MGGAYGTMLMARRAGYATPCRLDKHLGKATLEPGTTAEEDAKEIVVIYDAGTAVVQAGLGKRVVCHRAGTFSALNAASLGGKLIEAIILPYVLKTDGRLIVRHLASSHSS
jgi:hypothetical protein